jgi:hypothetical protein
MDTAPIHPVVKPPAEFVAHRDSLFRRTRTGLRELLPWWVWPLGAVLALAIVIAVWAAMFTMPLPSLPAEAVTPAFTVFPPPSQTPVPPTLTLTPFYTPTLALPTLAPGSIGIGVMVEVTEDGVRLRDSPSLTGRILSQASAHELFTIVDGPREADEHKWWLLQGVYDTARQGWAAQDFLRPSR